MRFVLKKTKSSRTPPSLAVMERHRGGAGGASGGKEKGKGGENDRSSRKGKDKEIRREKCFLERHNFYKWCLLYI